MKPIIANVKSITTKVSIVALTQAIAILKAIKAVLPEEAS